MCHHVWIITATNHQIYQCFWNVNKEWKCFFPNKNYCVNLVFSILGLFPKYKSKIVLKIFSPCIFQSRKKKRILNWIQRQHTTNCWLESKFFYTFFFFHTNNYDYKYSNIWNNNRIIWLELIYRFLSRKTYHTSFEIFTTCVDIPFLFIQNWQRKYLRDAPHTSSIIIASCDRNTELKNWVFSRFGIKFKMKYAIRGTVSFRCIQTLFDSFYEMTEADLIPVNSEDQSFLTEN